MTHTHAAPVSPLRLYRSEHTVPVSFCTIANRPNMGNMRKARFIWVKGFRVISVLSPWFSPFGAKSEGKFRGRGRGSMWQRLLTLWQAGSREKKYRTGWGRIQSSTNILPCYPLLPPSPCPLFFTEFQLHHQIGSPSGFSHCLEHSSQDAIMSQKTMSGAQVLSAWACNSQTMTFIYY